MKIETLKRGYWKIIVGVVAIVSIAATVVLTTSRANFRNTQSIPLVRGTINYKPYDFKIMAMYQENDSGEYTEIETMPSSGYVINEEKSYCYTTSSSEIDTNAILRTIGSEHVIKNLSKNSKCYLYFDKLNITTIQELIDSKIIARRTDFTVKLENDTTGTIFVAPDNDDNSFYFSGAATDNYVSFAGFFWRIIRINGDGSIRLIYDGTSARANGTSSEDTQIGTSAFNSAINDNMYMGYMYTANQLHGLGVSSTIKESLDNWFTTNLSSYTSYIDYDAGFCGDRTAYTDTSGTTAGGGTGTTVTYYGDYVRYWGDTSLTPTLKCTNSSDLYTTSSSSKGNKALSYPIGLINMNEVWMAGGYQAENTSYYLYTGQTYWTMSPYYFIGSSAVVFHVYSAGYLNGGLVNDTYGVRPVINLKANTEFTGNGSISSPLTVVGAE